MTTETIVLEIIVAFLLLGWSIAIGLMLSLFVLFICGDDKKFLRVFKVAIGIEAIFVFGFLICEHMR